MIKDVFWNVKRPTKPDMVHAQIEALLELQPDTIMLVEVAEKVSTLYESELKRGGYLSCEQIVSPLHGLLVASRFTLQRASGFDVPYRRDGIRSILAVEIGEPHGLCDLLCVHVPHFGVLGVEPGGKGDAKMATVRSVTSFFDEPRTRPLKCYGDFNTPIYEEADGRIILGLHRRNADGTWRFADGKARRIAVGQEQVEGEIWKDRGEAGVCDVRRRLCTGEALTEGSHKHNRRYYASPFDRCFATPDLEPVSFRYRQEFRERGLSDHAAVEVAFNRAR